MRILNLGSINIDHVYAVDHFVRAGETLAGSRYQIFAGGKGFNQSIALARAGAATVHVGRVGKDAAWLLQRLQKEGVDTTPVNVDGTATGHAIIQVVPSGENAIVLYGGANRAVTESDVAAAFSACSPKDCFLVQNETSSVAQAIRHAHQLGLSIVFNPAPMTDQVPGYPLDLVNLFILNETEAEGLTGATEPDAMGRAMRDRFPRAATVLTLGEKGAVYVDARVIHRQAAFPVKVVDTTAAGDTFIGYFLAEWMRSGDPARALERGCRAAAICVTRAGAADSIPRRDEVENAPSHSSEKRRPG